MEFIESHSAVPIVPNTQVHSSLMPNNNVHSIMFRDKSCEYRKSDATYYWN
jgi:hypothetical protein